MIYFQYISNIFQYFLIISIHVPSFSIHFPYMFQYFLIISIHVPYIFHILIIAALRFTDGDVLSMSQDQGRDLGWWPPSDGRKLLCLTGLTRRAMAPWPWLGSKGAVPCFFLGDTFIYIYTYIQSFIYLFIDNIYLFISFIFVYCLYTIIYIFICCFFYAFIYL